MFNPTRTNQSASQSVIRTTNHQGGVGFIYKDPRVELFQTVSSSLFDGSTFYESSDERDERFIRLASQCAREDARWTAGLAAYARQELNMRSGPAALVGELFLARAGQWAHWAADAVWRRGDEHLETIAYVLKRSPQAKSLKQLKLAVRRRLEDMTPRQLLKYRLPGREISQRYAIKFAHPVPRDEAQKSAFRYIARGVKDEMFASLRDAGVTWEQIRSAGGSWRDAYEVMPYFALLRNLRNLVQSKEFSEVELREIAARISARDEFGADQLFPYRYWIAWRELKEADAPDFLLQALESAANRSLDMLPDDLFGEGDILVLVDASGSMQAELSRNTDVSRLVAAAMLGAILGIRFHADVYIYGAYHTRVDVPKNPSVIPLCDKMCVNLGLTETGQAIKSLTSQKSYRHLLVITDEEAGDDADKPIRDWLRQDESRHAFVINVGGYQHTMASPHPRLHKAFGWSDGVLSWIRLTRVDPIQHIYDYIESSLRA